MSLTRSERLIEAGTLFLLVFTPLAFGTTERWSEAVAEVVILGMVLVYVLANVRSWEIRVELPPGWLPATLFLALAAFQIVTGWSADAHETRRYLLKLGAVAAFFVVCFNTYRTREQVGRAIWTMLATGTLVSIVGIIQRVSGNERLYGIGPRIEYGAPFGPYVNRAHFAGLMVVIVPAALVFLLTGTRERRRRALFRTWRDRFRDWNSSAGGARSLVPLGIVVMSVAALTSGSRGGMIALLVALSAMGIGVLTGRRSWSNRVARVLLALGLIALTAGWIAGDVVYGAAERLAQELGRPQESLRVALWADAVQLWRAAPLLGSGLGTFGVAFPRYRTIQGPRAFSHAESDWIQLLTDTGVLGLLLALLAVGAVAVALRRGARATDSRWARALALAALVGLVGTAVQAMGNFSLIVMSNLLYVALVVALAFQAQRETPP
jgi:O-antigen ligase